MLGPFVKEVPMEETEKNRENQQRDSVELEKKNA